MVLLGEHGIRVGTLAVMLLVFFVLMLYIVPQFKGVAGEPEMFGLLQTLSEAIHVPVYALAGAFLSGIIAIATGLILYLHFTGKLAEVV